MVGRAEPPDLARLDQRPERRDGLRQVDATVIPVGMVLLGVLAVLMPAHRIFYGVLTLVLAVYSIVGVNLGGFFVGMLLGAVGGILVVAWAPKKSTDVEAALPLVPSRT